MIKEETRVQTVQTKVVVSKTCTCDRCNKIIFHETMNTPHTHKYDYFKPIQYYKVTTGHNDWGNDSIDSVENLDICEDCLDYFFMEYHEKMNKIFNNSRYIEIEHEFTYEEKGEDEL